MEIEKIFIDQDISNFDEVEKIKAKFKNLKPKYINSEDDVYKYVSNSKDPILAGKKTLYLTKNKGAFLRNCPGTKNYICCGYKILHIGSFCNMDCSYCILQTYFHPPVLKYFVNKDDMFRELEVLFNEKKISRIGTGEFTDSLIWEKITNLSEILIPKFADQTSCILELKTKTVNINKLKKLNHNRKTILSWSLNTQKIIKSEERKTTSLDSRLNAAKKCESLGYLLSFHFDPIVIYDNCIKEYEKVIEKIFSYVSPENIAWISLGTFRFIPALKNDIVKRFLDSKIVYGEFINGLDGKMRYFKPLRINVFAKLISKIRQIAPDVLVYFCMEDNEVWQKTIGYVPEKENSLEKLLDNRAKKLCNLKI